MYHNPLPQGTHFPCRSSDEWHDGPSPVIKKKKKKLSEHGKKPSEQHNLPYLSLSFSRQRWIGVPPDEQIWLEGKRGDDHPFIFALLPFQDKCIPFG